MSSFDPDQILRDLPNYTMEEIKVKLAEQKAAHEKMDAETEVLNEKIKSATEQHPAINKDSVNGKRWDQILHAAEYRKQFIEKLQAEGAPSEEIAKTDEFLKKFEQKSANIIKGLKEKMKTVDPRLIGFPGYKELLEDLATMED